MTTNPRHASTPRRRATYLATNGGANPDDQAGTDINSLVAQYRRSGTMPTVYQQNPLWGDFTGPSDYHKALEQIEATRDRFNELPADVRSAANNDPEQFLAMFENDDQRVLLESAGLIISNNPQSDSQNPTEVPPSPRPTTATPPDTTP